MDKGYDNASWFYDRLSRAVFGRQLQQAQACFLQLIQPDARVLIVGGGSGWILEELARIQPEGLNITYVDASPRMVERAREKATQTTHVITFIAKPIQQAGIASDYDVIITPFFFDNFKESVAAEIFLQLHSVLKKDGLWLYTDFRNNGVAAHQLLLKSMYVFFSILCGVEAKQLPDMERLFSKQGYKLENQKAFVKGFVESKAWVK